MSAQSIAAIGAVATVIAGFGGAALGAYFAYRTGIKLVQKTHDNALQLTTINRFNEAAIDFQCAFLKAKQNLRDNSQADWDSILDSSTLLEHERAYLKFKQFLPEKDRGRFECDWNSYFSHRPHPGDRHPPQKAPEDWDNNKNCNIFLEQISTLLTYAKLK